MTLKSKFVRLGAGIIRRFRLPVLALFLIAAGAILSPALAQQDGESSVAIDAATFVPVDGRVLFLVRGISAYPAEKRAQGIGDRIGAPRCWHFSGGCSVSSPISWWSC